jgi:hypothetical protein
LWVRIAQAHFAETFMQNTPHDHIVSDASFWIKVEGSVKRNIGGLVPPIRVEN